RDMVVTIDDAPCPIASTPEALEAAIDALVGNVFAHTPEGTAFRVALQRATDECPPTLIVEDEGIGFADIELIERGASGAGSTGLGLDIARCTTEATGGSLVLKTATGGGTRV